MALPPAKTWAWTPEDEARHTLLFAEHVKALASEQGCTPGEIMRRSHDDPKLWGQVFCDHLLCEPDTGERYGDAEFHAEFYEHCANVVKQQDVYAVGGKRGFVGAAPRGHAKSTITLIVCLWALCEGWKRFIAIFTGTGDQAALIGPNMRAEFEDNAFVRLWYGDLAGLHHGKRWTTKDFVIVRTMDDGSTAEGVVMVRGCGSSVRGAKNRSSRPDMILLDDVDRDDSMVNATKREWLFTTWWSGQVLPMMHPLRGSVIVIGTILHYDSLLSRLLQRDAIYETRVWTCFNDDGESVWLQRFTTAYLRSLQQENPIAFAFEYLNDPSQTGSRPFLPENIRFYDTDDVVCDSDGIWWWQGQRLDIYAGVDPAISEEEDACQFACDVIGVTRDKENYLVLRALMDRLDFPAQVSAIEQFAAFFPQHRGCGIETVNYQRALAQQIRQQVRKKVRIIELRHGGGKATKRRRIIAISPLFAQGRIWFPAAKEGRLGVPDALGRVNVRADIYPLYKQVIQWPASELEDGVDALAMAIEAAEGLPYFSPGTFTGNWAAAAALA